MRIGIDCRRILHPGFGEKAGVGHYTYYLVKNLLKIDKKFVINAMKLTEKNYESIIKIKI